MAHTAAVAAAKTNGLSYLIEVRCLHWQREKVAELNINSQTKVMYASKFHGLRNQYFQPVHMIASPCTPSIIVMVVY